jgi:hypothetical protein
MSVVAVERNLAASPARRNRQPYLTDLVRKPNNIGWLTRP